MQTTYVGCFLLHDTHVEVCTIDSTDNITSIVKLYADDVLLYKVIDSLQDFVTLQQDLDTLQD